MDKKVHPVSAAFSKKTLLDKATYQTWYKQSIEQPELFWAARADELITWRKHWDYVLSGRFETGGTRWFSGARLNVSENCVDRHLNDRADKIAIIWEGDDPSESKTFTYRDMHQKVGALANVLKKWGVNKGDSVCIYLPMIPEAVFAMLACARIGAVHTVVFGGFSAEALKTRIQDVDCEFVITANEGLRGNKSIPLKKNVDEALKSCPKVRKVLVVKRTESQTPWKNGRDSWYHDAIKMVTSDCPPEVMQADDPLFILYTSGSTGKPKGILHGTAGYLVYAAMTFKYVFDYHEDDIYWCTADVGWITGHTYIVYGPLAVGATIVLFEGVPHYPTPARFWEVVDKHKVTVLYTAPTAIRALRREGDAWVKCTKRTSLRLLGSVGEPINPEAWEWYFNVVGEARCPIVDTWWQTETGGIMITALPGATPLKAGSASWPFFGVVPSVVDKEGNVLAEGKMGDLIIKQPWPGMMQTIYRNQERFITSYFTEFPGAYLTGDEAYQDEDGYLWIAGRSDDVIKVSGHRIGTQEIESALVGHPAVSEAAAVGVPDEVKGQHIVTYVVLKKESTPTDALRDELIRTVRNDIGAIATPEQMIWAEGLPKTRSGKIMRRLLRKIAVGNTDNLGDLSTLADPIVVEELMKRSVSHEK